ncbi:haloacid dehalogenase-like hydrolase [archaeon]|nr:haloacid dehalogenase-like hydrolase [archaeon]MBT3451689.1 haloacid dehalogenase-like hydrolase [archaeon]MBT6869379.1 haloacid dehalogenase-like hydrolase [archaeon]MBT7192542.1 haloacid dehalogenase-like hydrolase [archaeon]MBT7380618.1 haloacid dehalogenase-like hydrolase [archaeon]
MKQNIIAYLWDFDHTVSPYDMQKPLFEHFGTTSEQFFGEADEYRKRTKEEQGVEVDSENAYMNLMIDYAWDNKFPGLNNGMLREFGKTIEFFPGIPDFLYEMKRLTEEDPVCQKYGIKVEHYVITTGLTEMVRSSKLAGALDGVYGGEFVERQGPSGDPLIARIGRAIGFTKKTRFIFEINKGVNVYTELDVNQRIPHELRRVPFPNKCYISDGFTDVAAGTTVLDRDGENHIVYNPNSDKSFALALELTKQKRAMTMSEADYRPGKQIYKILNNFRERRIEMIVSEMNRQVLRHKR